MSKQHNEMDLVEDFISVYEIAVKDIAEIIQGQTNYMACVIPRSKAEKHYSACQLMFKKAISSVADSLGLENGTSVIKRIKDTKTTHDWRLEHNTGDMP